MPANGFDRELPRQGDWAGFASMRVPIRIWLGAAGEAGLVAAVSQVNVGRALVDHGEIFAGPLPDGAVAARVVPDVPALHRLVRRAFQLSRTLPDELLNAFRRKTAGLSASTEAERLVVQRVGQDLFRAGLLDRADPGISRHQRDVLLARDLDDERDEKNASGAWGLK